MSAADPIDGIHYLKSLLRTLPPSPGVYRMLNATGDVLYIGKAKNLRNRVSSYTQPERLASRIRKMVFETRELVIVETRTEAEALLLEANLIKALKPKYNVIFRDDSNYISVVITKETTPMIRKHRGAKRQAGDYFGPYPSADAVYRTLDTIERAFQLRTCADSTFKHRTRPCLKYDIKRCSAPCVTGTISPEDYALRVKQTKDFLRGKGHVVHQDLQHEMQAAAAALQYEKAADLRDRLQALSSITNNSTALTHAIGNGDVFAVVQQGGKAAIQGFFYRNGQHVGNHTYFPRGVEDLADGEILRLFLALHYMQRSAPPLVLTNTDVTDAPALAEALSQSAGHRVTLSTPQRGEKHTICQQAAHNAAQALARQVADSENWGEQLQAFGQLLGYTRTVQRVECFDISNISGKQPVASLVVAGPEGMDKRQYRKFSIQSKNTPDDYAMMAEALTRRYRRLLHDATPMPDIIMVDGGVGHLNVLVQVLHELGVLAHPECPALTAIAKGEERNKGLEDIFQYVPAAGSATAGKIQNLHVPLQSPLIFLLQRIRDEAHRFAIGFHRKTRSKVLTHSRLDDIPGIGPKRKKALLLHFGSLKHVEAADVPDLMRVPGISKAAAYLIYDFLH